MTNRVDAIDDSDGAEGDDPPRSVRPASERRSRLALGVVVERRPVANPWAEEQYLPVAVLPNAAPADWAELPAEATDPEGVKRWHAATVEVALHRADTDAYRHNLLSDNPAVYVVLRPAEDAQDEHEVRVVCATLSPYEAQDFLDSGDDIVEPVPLPEQLAAWVEDFIARHHREVPFKKRKRQPHRVDDARFGKQLHPVESAFYERRDRIMLRPDDETEGEA